MKYSKYCTPTIIIPRFVHFLMLFEVQKIFFRGSFFLKFWPYVQGGPSGSPQEAPTLGASCRVGKMIGFFRFQIRQVIYDRGPQQIHNS